MARRSKAQNSQPLTLLDMIEQAEGAGAVNTLSPEPDSNSNPPQSIEQQRHKLQEHKDDSVPWEEDPVPSQDKVYELTGFVAEGEAGSEQESTKMHLRQATHTAQFEKIVTGTPGSNKAHEIKSVQDLTGTQLGNTQEGIGSEIGNEQAISKLAHGVHLSRGQASHSASSAVVIQGISAPMIKTSATTKRKSTKPKFELEPFQYPLDPVQYVVCGIDEAGRGPLMGDVVAACVILDHNKMIPGIDDSKHLSEKKRDALAPVIKQYALAYGVGRASPAEIDELNILHATFLAMRRAYEMMQVTCNLALIDGNKIPPGFNIACQAVVKGDARVKEIGAASILAKTTRDADLYELDKQYPEYKFAQHKGYPTAAHLEVLSKLPILPCYRFSYGPVKKLIAERNLQILPDHTLVARTQ